MGNALMGRLKDIFAGLTGKNRFEKLDFVLLKTALMLAAAREKALAERYPQGAKFDASLTGRPC